MTEQLKDFLEQEGMTPDDVINKEIEREHAENETTYLKIYSENNGNTVIYATDKPSDNNNAYHNFLITYEPDADTPKQNLQEIKLQNGNFAEYGHNGIFVEHLLVIALDTLKRFNTSKYSCRENAIAITKLEEVLTWLEKRMAKRVERGVYGTGTV